MPNYTFTVRYENRSTYNQVYDFMKEKRFVFDEDMWNRFGYTHDLDKKWNKISPDDSMEVASALDDLHLSGKIKCHWRQGDPNKWCWALAEATSQGCICTYHDPYHRHRDYWR